MDDSDLLKLSGMSAGTLSIILIIYKVLKSLQGKKLISQCCGKRYDVGFVVRDLETDTPKLTQNPIKNITVVVDEPRDDNGSDSRGRGKNQSRVCETEGAGRVQQGTGAVCGDDKRANEGREGKEKEDEEV